MQQSQLGYGESLSDEKSNKKSNNQEKELIYATVPKEDIEAKRVNKHNSNNLNLQYVVLSKA